MELCRDRAQEEKKKGIIQKRVYPVTFDAKKGNVFLALGRGAVRALNTSKRRSYASAPRPRCLGSIPDHFFSIFKSAIRSNCSAENEGLYEYPFLQINQEGTPGPQLEVYPLPFFV